jgi:hypothetical protein
MKDLRSAEEAMAGGFVEAVDQRAHHEWILELSTARASSFDAAGSEGDLRIAIDKLAAEADQVAEQANGDIAMIDEGGIPLGGVSVLNTPMLPTGDTEMRTVADLDQVVAEALESCGMADDWLSMEIVHNGGSTFAPGSL